jgi:hypothetical protein
MATNKVPFSYQRGDYTSIEMAPISMNQPFSQYQVLSTAADKSSIAQDAKQNGETARRAFIALVGSLFLFSMFRYTSGGNAAFLGSSSDVDEDTKKLYAIPTRYHTIVELNMPYIGLVEPFEIWTDMDLGLQRMSYWGDLNRFYLNETGPGCQIMPISIDGKSSAQISARIPLWQPAVVFPNLFDPQFTKSKKLEKVRGVNCEVWELEEDNYDAQNHGYVGR